MKDTESIQASGKRVNAAPLSRSALIAPALKHREWHAIAEAGPTLRIVEHLDIAEDSLCCLIAVPRLFCRV
jgi:hypothetical protein